ncbi:MAG: thioredoxin family protein [Promethearchaeota archaeon]
MTVVCSGDKRIVMYLMDAHAVDGAAREKDTVGTSGKADGTTGSHAGGDDEPEILFFSSTSCAPCVRIERMLEEINTSMFGRKLRITKIDTPSNPEKAREYLVYALPTLVIGGKKLSVSIEKAEIIDAILTAYLSSVKF